MSFFEKGAVRIHYEEAGSGFPLLLIAGGGLNSNISGITGDYPPFNAMKEFGDEYRCIAFDLRNAPPGQSSGPLEIDRPWDSHTDDQLALMDHLGFDKFMVLGFCIGGPLIWNLLKRAPDRVVAGVLAMPWVRGPKCATFLRQQHEGLGAGTDKTPARSHDGAGGKIPTKMYRTNPDFVFTVTRDFVNHCQTPVLILPDDIPRTPMRSPWSGRCWRRTPKSACSPGRSRRSACRWRCARSAPSCARTGRRRYFVGWVERSDTHAHSDRY